MTPAGRDCQAMLRRGGVPPYGWAMADRPTPEDERKRRLADALRQNLRRRKAQARGDDIPGHPRERALLSPSKDGDPE